MLRLVVVLLIAYSTSVILATSQGGPPILIIDGYNISGPINSPADLPLGTTLVLICRVGNVPSELEPNFSWMCRNESCRQNGYAGRNIGVLSKLETVLAINITSEHDSGTYTCIVSPEGRQRVRKEFKLNVIGGKVVHSYGRLILNEGVISDRQQLQPPNNASGDGIIECRVRSGEAKFDYYGSNQASDKYETKNDGGSNATVFIKEGALASGKFALEGRCAGLFHYLFLNNETICNNLKFEYSTGNQSTITVTVGELPSGIARAIVGYTRLDLGLPVEGEYVNLQACGSTTFSSLVPGTKYRITAWGLGGGVDGGRKRCQSPTVIEVTTWSKDVGASPPRNMTMTRECKDGMVLNWIPPKEPNGDILCYNITMQNETHQNVVTTNNTNYHTLTGMVKGQRYNISVAAFNGQPGEKTDMSYVHNPNTTLPCEVPGKIPTLDITAIIINCTAGLLIEWEEPKSTLEIIAYNVMIYLKGKDIIRILNTTKNYQLVQGLNTSTVYRVLVAAISMGGRGAEVAYEVSTLSVLGFIAECSSIPNPNIVTFNSNSTIVSESEAILLIDVYRYGQMEGFIELNVKAQDGKAKESYDYDLQCSYLYFIQTTKMMEKATVVIKIKNDDEKEDMEEFKLILSAESGDKVVFTEQNITIYIEDDDPDTLSILS